MAGDRGHDRSLAGRWVVDGPPFLGVAFVFVALQALSLGAGRPALGFAVLALGLVAAIILDFRHWLQRTGADRRAAVTSLDSLRQRLDRARAQELQRAHGR